MIVDYFGLATRQRGPKVSKHARGRVGKKRAPRRNRRKR